MKTVKSLELLAQRALWLAMGRRRNQVTYVVERVNWSVTWDGHYISQGVNRLGIVCTATHQALGQRNAVVHCGSLGLTLRFAELAAGNRNQVVSTIFHGDFGISTKMDSQLEQFLGLVPMLSRIVVANGTMRLRLERWGVPSNKIKQIPIGVDLKLFRAQDPALRQSIRDRFDIPPDVICVGSFQKDGEGWPDGQTPKWIKGPDVFVQTVLELAKHHRIHCLLTGPSRGYVTRRLTKEGVSFTHLFLDRYQDIADCYACLDLYLITSREEGGPKAVLEATACGIPVVSTRVGMVQEVLADNSMIATDQLDLFRKALAVCDNLEFSSGCARQKSSDLAAYDWKQVAIAHRHLYAELLGLSPDLNQVV